MDGKVTTEVKIDSEEFKNEEGKDIRVSSIEITLTKKK
jgi:DNA-binding protein